MYYCSPFEAHAAIDQYERDVKALQVVREALDEARTPMPVTAADRKRLAWRSPFAALSFARHA